MYTPEPFRVDDPEALAAFLRRHPFGVLVTTDAAGRSEATHLPFLYEARGGPHGLLRGHMALANPQWRHFGPGREALVIVQGPHGYVSPAWYGEHPAVPTWNYAAVHARGAPRLLEPDDTWALLEDMVAAFEAHRPAPWRMALPADYAGRMLAAVVGFEVPLTRLEGKFKLSQNRPPGDPPRVAAALADSPRPGDRELAAFMRSHGLDEPEPGGE